MALFWKKETEQELLARESGFVRTGSGIDRAIVSVVALGWALFQLALPRLLLLDSIAVRAVHLAFALVLAFLTIPVRRGRPNAAGSRVPVTAYVLAVVAVLSALYIVLDWRGISTRPGLPIRRDIIAGVLLIAFVLEASRRSVPACHRPGSGRYRHWFYALCVHGPIYAAGPRLQGRLGHKVSQLGRSVHKRHLRHSPGRLGQYGLSVRAVRGPAREAGSGAFL